MCCSCDPVGASWHSWRVVVGCWWLDVGSQRLLQFETSLTSIWSGSQRLLLFRGQNQPPPKVIVRRPQRGGGARGGGPGEGGPGDVAVTAMAQGRQHRALAHSILYIMHDSHVLPFRAALRCAPRRRAVARLLWDAAWPGRRGSCPRSRDRSTTPLRGGERRASAPVAHIRA